MEIEVKMRLTDPAAIEARLESLGATRRARLLETNVFLDRPDGSLRAADRGLRVRLEQELDRNEAQVVITHKGPRRAGEVKEREETELTCESLECAVALLEALGFQRGLSFEKRRDKWTLEDCEVCLDRMPRLGSFLEIEGPSRETVLRWRERLGLADARLIRESYATMLAEALGAPRSGDEVVRLEER